MQDPTRKRLSTSQLAPSEKAIGESDDREATLRAPMAWDGCILAFFVSFSFEEGFLILAKRKTIMILEIETQPRLYGRVAERKNPISSNFQPGSPAAYRTPSNEEGIYSFEIPDEK